MKGRVHMKFSFSTLGCPQWNWRDILAIASDLGYDGIEVRGVERKRSILDAEPFWEKNIEKTLEDLKRHKLSIPCLTSYCSLSNKSNINEITTEIIGYIDIAARMGIPYVRVIGDDAPEAGENVDMDFVFNRYKEMAEYAATKDVRVLLETNGVYANSDIMLEVMKRAANPGAGVLWDIHHPYRFYNESVEDTYKKLKEYICFVHVKDSVVIDNKVKYGIIGTGDVPVEKCLELLKKDGFSGFVSLEWVKQWCPELEEPGIVFPHFINWIRTY